MNRNRPDLIKKECGQSIKLVFFSNDKNQKKIKMIIQDETNRRCRYSTTTTHEKKP